MSKDLIVKGNNLIEASYRLTLTEIRLVLKMVSTIKKDDTDLTPYKFSVSDLLDEFSMHSGDYKEIKKATSGLLSKVMSIEDLDRKRTLQINFISSAEYYEGQGIVELSFDPKLKPYLLQLRKNFTSFHLSTIKKLKSPYTIRIYELAKQFKKAGQRQLTVDDLKKKLGIPPNQYQRYGHFKQRILLPALKDINQHTELSVTIEESTFGRKIDKILFRITSPKNSPPIVEGLDRLVKQHSVSK